jgi:hypothetical protein
MKPQVKMPSQKCQLALSFLLGVNFYEVEFDHGTPLALQIANQLQ